MSGWPKICAQYRVRLGPVGKTRRQLRSMKRRLSRIDPDSEEAADLEFDIERIENKMLKLECSRFEDFG